MIRTVHGAADRLVTEPHAARNYRVQVQGADGHSWQMYASFGFRSQAEDCCQQLIGQGFCARVTEAFSVLSVG